MCRVVLYLWIHWNIKTNIQKSHILVPTYIFVHMNTLHLQVGGRHVAHLEHYATPTAWREAYRQPRTLWYTYSLEVDMPSTSNIMLHQQPRGRHVAHLEHYVTPTPWRETYRQPRILCYTHRLEADMSPTSNIMLHLQLGRKHIVNLEHYTTSTAWR